MVSSLCVLLPRLNPMLIRCDQWSLTMCHQDNIQMALSLSLHSEHAVMTLVSLLWSIWYYLFTCFMYILFHVEIEHQKALLLHSLLTRLI